MTVSSSPCTQRLVRCRHRWVTGAWRWRWPSGGLSRPWQGSFPSTQFLLFLPHVVLLPRSPLRGCAQACASVCTCARVGRVGCVPAGHPGCPAPFLPCPTSRGPKSHTSQDPLQPARPVRQGDSQCRGGKRQKPGHLPPSPLGRWRLCGLRPWTALAPSRVPPAPVVLPLPPSGTCFLWKPPDTGPGWTLSLSPAVSRQGTVTWTVGGRQEEGLSLAAPRRRGKLRARVVLGMEAPGRFPGSLAAQKTP